MSSRTGLNSGVETVYFLCYYSNLYPIKKGISLFKRWIGRDFEGPGPSAAIDIGFRSCAFFERVVNILLPIVINKAHYEFETYSKLPELPGI